MQWWLTIGSIRIAVLALMLVLLWKAWYGKANDRSGFGPLQWLWLLGAVGSIVHMLATLGWNHHWSHQAAWHETAARTKALLGVEVGAGIYFNYLFVGLWLIDAVWMNKSPGSYARRPAWWDPVVTGYLLFITFNGAVVFASGWFRWLSALLFGLLALGFIAGRGVNKMSNHSNAT